MKTEKIIKVIVSAIIGLIICIFVPLYSYDPVLFFILIFVIIAGLICFIVQEIKKKTNDDEE